MATRQPLTCGILAGGPGTRMGRNKALMPFRGRPLLERQLAVLRPLFERVLIGTNDPAPYAGFGLPLVADLLPEQCALTGIHAILAAAQTEDVFVVACDMPYLNGALIRALVGRRTGYDAVVPVSNRGLEPLHAVYARRCREAIEATVAAGSWKATDFYGRVRADQWRVRDERWAVEGHSPFANLNTPDDLRRAGSDMG